MIESARFYQLVRDFAATTPAWGTAIRYQTLPDEELDLTLVSQRVYGNRNEAFTILAAAGLDHFDDPLPPQILVLPTASQLDQIKRSSGYGR